MTPSVHTDDIQERNLNVGRFAIRFALLITFIALLPALFAFAVLEPGIVYLGTPFNTDDHMVYAAWMRQAQDGAFFFDNRFTTEAQPGRTVHLYFWTLGLLSKATGIVAAATLGRAIFTGLFVWLLWRLISRTSLNIFVSKLALVLGCTAGGLGFLVWHNFGRVPTRPVSQPFSPLFGNHLPVDVWQPEVFTFPSMLTNGLFMVSLCLMLVIFTCVLDSRDSWKPVLPGALAFGVLMNIHSYDVLLIALVLVGLVVAGVRTKMFTFQWLGRVAVMALGTLPAAAWFVHVLRIDPVFQARAATPTFTSGVPTLIGGLAPALVLVFIALWNSEQGAKTSRLAVIVGSLGIAVMGVVGYRTFDGYAFAPAAFAASIIGALVVVWLGARKDVIWNLLVAWCFVGFVAPFWPALFQRKLAAGLIIPFAILGAVGLAEIMRRFDRHQRNLIAGFFCILLCTSSVLWLRREFDLIRDNVSTTTVQPAFLNRDATAILALLNNDSSQRKVVLSIGGVQSRGSAPDEFGIPYVPDLNPVWSGLAGCYTYAGHWSETPDHLAKLRESGSFFSGAGSLSEREAFLEKVGADYLVSVNLESYPDSPFADIRTFGEVLYEGNQLVLVKVR